MLGTLVKANPNLELEIIATDRLVDIVEDGFDAGIRPGREPARRHDCGPDRRRLRFSVVGAPAYFERHPILVRRPSSMGMSAFEPVSERSPYAWEFKHGGRTIEFNPTGPIATDDHELMGAGRACRHRPGLRGESRAEREIADGRLVRCLEPWCAPRIGSSIYYPTRKYLSAGLRAVIQALRAWRDPVKALRTSLPRS